MRLFGETLLLPLLAEAEGPILFCNKYTCAHGSQCLHRSIVFSKIWSWSCGLPVTVEKGTMCYAADGEFPLVTFMHCTMEKQEVRNDLIKNAFITGIVDYLLLKGELGKDIVHCRVKHMKMSLSHGLLQGAQYQKVTLIATVSTLLAGMVRELHPLVKYVLP